MKRKLEELDMKTCQLNYLVHCDLLGHNNLYLNAQYRFYTINFVPGIINTVLDIIDVSQLYQWFNRE